MKLRLHVHHVLTGGWCADIDDDLDRQPDDPYWCNGYWPALEDAIVAGCDQLARLSATARTTRRLARVSGRYDDPAPAPAH